jgi:hypothetical protein
MAYLGALGTPYRHPRLAYTRLTIALVLLPEVSALYASHGGYVYVA